MDKKEVYTHTQKYYSALKKKENSTLWNNMNVSGGYYAKGNKPVTEEQALLDSIYMRYLKW